MSSLFISHAQVTKNLASYKTILQLKAPWIENSSKWLIWTYRNIFNACNFMPLKLVRIALVEYSVGQMLVQIIEVTKLGAILPFLATILKAQVTFLGNRNSICFLLVDWNKKSQSIVCCSHFNISKASWCRCFRLYKWAFVLTLWSFRLGDCFGLLFLIVGWIFIVTLITLPIS
jgi:hypothetical protein